VVSNIPTLAIYVDYKKAYDRVWHTALLTKLETRNTHKSTVPECLPRKIQNFVDLCIFFHYYLLVKYIINVLQNSTQITTTIISAEILCQLSTATSMPLHLSS